VLSKKANDINVLAADLFNEFSHGKNTRGAKGILVVIDPEGEKVKMEIGYDLEHIYPDIFVAYVEDKQMLPFFENGKVGVGIEATVELIIAKAKGAVNKALYDPKYKHSTKLSHYSGGAGASATVTIDSKDLIKDTITDKSIFSADFSPEITFNKYKNVLKKHIKDPNLGIYTPESRKFYKKWIVTDAQQDNSLRDINNAGPSRLFTKGNYAVIRFPVKKREASPFFLKKGDRGWMLDFVSMNKNIRFNYKNYWHFISRNHKYMFAFKDWRFDKHGYPHLKK